MFATILQVIGAASITYGVERVSVTGACVVGGAIVAGYGFLFDYLAHRSPRVKS